MSTAALLVLLVCVSVTTTAPAVAATSLPGQQSLILVLFDDLQDPGGLDANSDGALTVADILLLSAEILPTPTATRPATATPSPTSTGTHTVTPTVTLTPTPSVTPTETLTPTPVGLLFAGSVAQFVPHGLGDQLVYRVTDPLGSVTTETTIVTSSDAGGGFVIDDQEVKGQQLRKHETQSYVDTGTQLFFTGGSDLLNGLRTTCAPRLLRLMMPVIAGQMFSTVAVCDVFFISSGAKVGFIDRTDSVVPVEIVASRTVPAGTYTQVVHISGTTDLSDDIEHDEVYFAPGVGAILQLSTAGGKTTTRELISGTVGGVPVNR